MPKNALFWKQKLQISPQRWGLRPQSPLIFRGWGPRPKFSACYTHLLLQTVSAHDSSANARLIAVEKNKSNNNSKGSLLFPHLPIFHFKLGSFCWCSKNTWTQRQDIPRFPYRYICRFNKVFYLKLVGIAYTSLVHFNSNTIQCKCTYITANIAKQCCFVKT